MPRWSWIGSLGGEKPRYQIVRFLLLRMLGWVYLTAFLVVVNQAKPLIGSHGLTPAPLFLREALEQFGSTGAAFWKLPGLFWLHYSDGALLAAGWLGVALSTALLLGYANSISLFILWALYLSIIHIGQVWWSYGWETQLTETGFLAIFLVPWLDPRPFPKQAPPIATIWLYRWLAFRLFLGAGLIKLRGDPCWRELTCLDFHFLTQPNPNPLSPLFHFAPHWVHVGDALYNHLVELVCPLFVFWPRRARHLAGALMLVFQVVLILSGNLSFLNWLSIVPLFACFDDQLLLSLVPSRLRQRLRAREAAGPPGLPARIAAWTYFAIAVALSWGPAKNLISDRQRMNFSYEPFNLVNSYGAFGSVGKERHEIVFEGADSSGAPEADWKPYELKCKPGDIYRRPCWISPYHLRLDWQIWFAAMSDVRGEPWTVHLVEKLLRGDPDTLGLLAGNPFPQRPPRYIRASYYRYRFAPLGDRAFWSRERQGLWLPALSLDDPRLQRFLSEMGWQEPPPAGADE